MSSVTRVPETTSMSGEELTADDAWRTIRTRGATIWVEAFARFRYGDGFSHARALGLQLCLAFIPLVIATVGLSGTLVTQRIGRVLRLTLVSLAPGGSADLLRETLDRPGPEADGAELALWLGLLVAVVALTTAMGQVERGANRIYGVQRDRPGPAKYGRALRMAFGVGLPAMVGFGVLIAVAAFGDAVEQVYGFDDDAVTLLALPLAILLLLGSITAMLRWAPRRRQPGWSWLGLGAGVALLLWLVFTGLLVAYVAVSGSFGAVYGPLTGVIALLLWAQLTSVAIFFGMALSAQLEAARVGVDHGAVADPR
ncbi:MAG: YihY/virulence factor BrkB family protein [Pseudonocardia sp.]|nr:YihY/virulence factor BrkB family protein [Pseudonocardia sp.]